MNLPKFLSVGVLAGALMALTSPSLALQHEGHDHDDHEQHHHAEPWVAKWTDAEIGRVADLLSGTWRTLEAIPEHDSESRGASKIVMQIWPVPIEDVPNALIVETSREDEMDAPYRYAVFSMYRYKNAIRLRTYELRWNEARQQVLGGTWASPGEFPSMSRADLIATLDVQLTGSGNAYSGQTPYPYPTGAHGAVEMTSSIQLSPTRLVTGDRGMDADGNVVWGADKSSEWTWQKIENPAKIIDFGGGLIAVEYYRPAGESNAPGDTLHMHYSGWTRDGNQFDSSRTRDRTFAVEIPSPGRLIDGWNTGLADMTVGTKRRLIIPGHLAYGEQGMPRANIPPNATLYFEVELMHLQKLAAPAAEPAKED